MTNHGKHGNGEISSLYHYSALSPSSPHRFPAAQQPLPMAGGHASPLLPPSSRINNVVPRLRLEQLPVQVLPLHQVLMAVKVGDFIILNEKTFITEV